ncbi:MAG: AI-2E family transporter [Clostridiales bacterium]|nr:AI-2E family transporter [Clostridiales bacterium]
MRIPIPENEKNRVQGNIIVCIVAAVLLACVLYIGNVSAFFGKILSTLSPFMVGAAFAFMLLPLAKRTDIFLEKRLKWKKSNIIRGISTTLCMILLVAAIIGFALILLPQLVASFQSLVGVLTNFVNNNESTINDFLIKNGLITVESTELNSIWDNLLSTATQYITVVIPNILSLSSKVYSFVFQLFVGLIVACHFLIEKEGISCRCKRASYALFAQSTAESLIFWMRKANTIFSGFISGKIIDSLIIGIVCYVFMLITNMEYAVLISVVIGITNILPFFGPFIGAIPSVLILLMINPRNALIFTIFILVLQQIDGNLIGPKILGDHVGISPLWTMIAIILGSGLFGFVGILLSVPVFALIYALVNTFFEAKLKSKNLPLKADQYQKAPPVK